MPLEKNAMNTIATRLMAAAAAACVLLAVAFQFGGAAASPKVYFYNPESNINNFSSLKAEFDSYLADFGKYEFQPFSNRENFEQFITQDQAALFLLSSWHFQDLRSKYQMKPVLVGSAGGKTTQRRVIVALKPQKNIVALRGQTIASAGHKDFTQSMLNQILGRDGHKDIADSMRIISVPKDIDALMAVGLGMAFAGITSESALEQLRTVNPKQYDLLLTLGKSDELPRVIVAVKESNPDTLVLVKAFEQMSSARKGEYAMQMIGLDGWRRYEESGARPD